MKEKYSYYEFQIKKHQDDFWSYEIYGFPCYPYDDGVIESTDYFETSQEARFAAIGHIDLLENGPPE